MKSRSRNLIAGVGSVAILTAVILAIGDVKKSPERYLLIHSDDAGFSDAVNEATIRAMEQGVVSSSSIMVMLPGFDEIADYAIKHPEKDFGVHLVLTCEKSTFRWGPVLKGEVPSLVEPDGGFWHRSEDVAQRVKLEEAERELRAQIRKALDRKVPITHLDHHMWVMLQRPDLLRLYIQLGIEFQLPIRLHRTFTPAECGRLLQDSREYESLIRPAVTRGMPLLDFIETNNYDVPPTRKLAYYLKQLKDLKPGLSEFVVHCSTNRSGSLLPNAPDRREADTRAFTSQEVCDEIRKQGIRVVTWKEIVRLQAEGKLDGRARGKL